MKTINCVGDLLDWHLKQISYDIMYLIMLVYLQLLCFLINET